MARPKKYKEKFTVVKLTKDIMTQEFMETILQAEDKAIDIFRASSSGVNDKPEEFAIYKLEKVVKVGPNVGIIAEQDQRKTLPPNN